MPLCYILLNSFLLQKSFEASDKQNDSSTNTETTPHPQEPPATEVERRVTITFAQLVNNFTNIFKGIAKRHGLSDPGYTAISINQMKSFLDEFSKGRCEHIHLHTFFSAWTVKMCPVYHVSLHMCIYMYVHNKCTCCVSCYSM